MVKNMITVNKDILTEIINDKNYINYTILDVDIHRIKINNNKILVTIRIPVEDSKYSVEGYRLQNVSIDLLQYRSHKLKHILDGNS